MFLKSRADWDGIRNDVKNVNWNNICKANCSVTSINEALKNIILTRIPSKVIKTKIKDKPWFNELCLQACREKQSAYRL